MIVCLSNSYCHSKRAGDVTVTNLKFTCVYAYIYVYIYTYIDVHINLIATETAANTGISTNFNSSSQIKGMCFFRP